MGQQVGNWVRVVRERKGMSQMALARALNLKTPQGISNIERGHTPLSRHHVVKLAKVFHLPRATVVDQVIKELRAEWLEAVAKRAAPKAKAAKASVWKRKRVAKAKKRVRSWNKAA